MATLTKIISARVGIKLVQRIEAEVKARRKAGNHVDGADITREALVEYFAERDGASRTGKGEEAK